MAGFGKNPRHGKRPSSSSSSSYFSTVSMVVLVAFCLLGVWMLTSSAVSPPQSTAATTVRHSRAANRPPDLDIDDDEPKSESKLEETTTESNQQQDEAVNQNGDEEKTGSFLSKQQQNDGETSAEQEAHDDQQLPGEENQQQQQGEIDFDKQQDTNQESAEKTASQETEEQQPEQTNELENPREQTNELESQREQTHEQQQEQTNDLENQGEHTQEQLENQGQTNELQREQTNELESQQETQEKREHTNDSENQLESHEQREQTNNLENQLEQRNDLENPGESHEQLQEQTNDLENQKEIQEHQEQQTNDGENPQETHEQLLKQTNDSENQNEIQEHQDQQTNDLENLQETHEQQREQTTNDLDSQQETHDQQQGTESNIDVTQQQSQSETGENQGEAQQQIEVIQEGGNEDQFQSEQQTDTGGGNNEDHQQETSNGNQQQGDKLMEPNAENLLPDAAAQSEVPNDSDGKKRAWATQADHSKNEKERRKESDINLYGHEWELCNVTAGPDYIPCLDNEKAIKKLHIKHYEHRERHCPEESPTCLVPLPTGYKQSIEWPTSRDKIWYNNVPRTKLAEVKGHQNWVKVTGEFLTFPGGGTQFIHGALHYIDFLQQSVHDIAWGKHTRVVLDVGCGVASFGGYLFERDVLTMSFAPKDEHEAQVQFALERGIPAISAVMGSQRLQFPSKVFDVVHCARCRVPWHADGGTLLLELNRVLRPGGYFVWSATPVYQRLKEDVEIWKAMKSLTVSMCWDLITIKKDKLNGIGAAFFRKPVSNECYDNRKHHSPPMCKEDDDPNAAWYIPLKACMHRVPVGASERGSQWPEQWPRRVQVPPYWLNSSQIGVYGKAAPDDFTSDYEHWKRVVTKSYLTGFGINWTKVRNVMDMRAVYGGFAAALKDMKVWVLNVVNIDSPDTLPIIYERGLFGIYHDWCESFSTYPRTYDLLHADHLFSRLKKRCKIVSVMAEVDRIMRPGGKLIVRDESGTVSEVENLLKSLHWDVNLTFSKDQEGILCAEKSDWRPEKFSDSS